jgi:hypothetical protein
MCKCKQFRDGESCIGIKKDLEAEAGMAMELTVSSPRETVPTNLRQETARAMLVTLMIPNNIQRKVKHLWVNNGKLCLGG